jgi:heme-degrading monooxygenase HmoA
MSAEVRVLVYHSTEDGEGIEKAYHEVSTELSGVPGMLGNELLRSLRDGTGFVVLSRWRDLAAFTEWEQGARHRDSTAPLRPYQDRKLSVPFGIYEVTAAYG